VLLRLLRDVIDFCYPGICASCRQPCAVESFACESCLGELSLLEQHAACELCGMPLATDGAPCPFCVGDGVRNYERILRLGTFDDPLKNLIHQMKYSGRWTLAERLAERLLSQPRIAECLANADVIVPVPLHRFRQFSRGYNQAAVIARYLSVRVRVDLASPLVRVRNTETQTHLHSRAKRVANLRNAFRLKHPATIAGKRVIVIDDVMTTGATLQAVARTLRPAKPASLTAIVLAIADPKRRGFEVV
jgi:ComF family protein